MFSGCVEMRRGGWTTVGVISWRQALESPLRSLKVKKGFEKAKNGCYNEAFSPKRSAPWREACLTGQKTTIAERNHPESIRGRLWPSACVPERSMRSWARIT